MKYYVGMDLHSNNTVIGIMDEKGKKVYSKRVDNFIKLILAELEPFEDKIAGVVVESTFNWYWLVDGLMEAGYQLHLANPVAIKQYSGLKYTNDYHDAFHLAELLRLDILPEGYIYPKQGRALRDLLRKRLMLVRHRTAYLLSFQSLYNRHKGNKFRGADVKKLKAGDTAELFDSEYVIHTGEVNISVIGFLSQKIEKIEKLILGPMKLVPSFKKLKTVTGIGDILALTVSLETGDISRFPKVGNYASYCRCVSSQRVSNEKKKGQNNRKNGNKYLGWAFVEAANFSRRYCPKAESFHQRKLAKTNKVVAIKALAHKLARAAYYVMRDNVNYDPEKLFG